MGSDTKSSGEGSEKPPENLTIWLLFAGNWKSAIYLFIWLSFTVPYLVQHYLYRPRHLLRNTIYNRVVWFKLIAFAVHLCLSVGFRMDATYPCCGMVSIFFHTFLPVFGPKLHYTLLYSTGIISCFAQVTFIMKRWERNARGPIFPSFKTLLECHFCFLGFGVMLYMCLQYLGNVDLVNFDPVKFCTDMEVKACAADVEEDSLHFLIEFQYVAILRFIGICHAMGSVVLVFYYHSRLYDQDTTILFAGDPLDRESDRSFERQAILGHVGVSTCLAIPVHWYDVQDVLFGNFPTPRNIESIYWPAQETILGIILYCEYVDMSRSENYYTVLHLPRIVSNVFNHVNWNEGVLPPRQENNIDDFY